MLLKYLMPKCPSGQQSEDWLCYSVRQMPRRFTKPTPSLRVTDWKQCIHWSHFQNWLSGDSFCFSLVSLCMELSLVEGLCKSSIPADVLAEEV